MRNPDKSREDAEMALKSMKNGSTLRSVDTMCRTIPHCYDNKID